MTEHFKDLMGIEKEDRTEYLGFPPYTQDNYDAPYTVEIEFKTDADVKKFVEVTGAYKTLLEDGLRSVKSFWCPELGRGERGGGSSYLWVEDEGEENAV